MITHKKLKEEYEITDGQYRILCEIEDGKLCVYTSKGKGFMFLPSTPETVEAIGNLISYAAGLAKKEIV